jgi:hypothetical protein
MPITTGRHGHVPHAQPTALTPASSPTEPRLLLQLLADTNSNAISSLV